MDTYTGFSTKAIHAGQDPKQWNHGAVIPPIVMSTTFEQDAPGQHRGYEYGRSGNPTRNVLEACLAALEDGKHAIAYSSGLGATTAVTSLINSGDHLICGDDLYGGTNRYFRNCLIKHSNIDVTFVDTTKTKNVIDALKPNTKMIWLESPTNPLLKITDISAIVDGVKSRQSDIIIIVDNTFLTCYFQRPLEMGVDIVIYSLTKYMNGHSDVIMGAAITRRDDLGQRMRYLQNAMGIVPSPHDCSLVNRGLKTLELRMEKHMKNGLAIAEFLERHPKVEKVLHPYLPSHPQHRLAIKQTSGHSGMVSFYLKGDPAKFLKALKIFTLAESLGGYESLIEIPSIMTHASVPLEMRNALGITDNLVRISVGIESEEDLIADLNQALDIC
ncbi:putative cystathionine gamma-lyase 2 isoform X2 [Harpegnathos saltator]|uniref:cystathionine gamma-lyase n=2 Tax=Harpegnathos saltator TaxID=610380 RepID=E2B8U9_HARSA|nr:putative cystathionine gamma-lyase 2 isoform X2 [Harpegnathos saltator]XP_011154746.1 putative cystathionine gamma-lyase 2 isoform X2 [Harpegnathos saltator]XP_025162962.1 putative cystathionine gamma-lyase 2 isoform X2 [Harpegnathos saltator]EFN87889.1 Cystathionine gamma-lyase [Harpegnathos saltator]